MAFYSFNRDQPQTLKKKRSGDNTSVSAPAAFRVSERAERPDIPFFEICALKTVRADRTSAGYDPEKSESDVSY